MAVTIEVADLGSPDARGLIGAHDEYLNGLYPPADQGEAIRLYERAGFVPVPCFGEYANAPRSRCFQKDLTRDH